MGLQDLLYAVEGGDPIMSDGITKRFTAKKIADGAFDLKIGTVQLNDTARYFCASSVAHRYTWAEPCYKNPPLVRHWPLTCPICPKVDRQVVRWGLQRDREADVQVDKAGVIPSTSVRAVLQRILPLALTPDWGVSLEISNAPTPKASEQERTVLDGWPIAGSGRQRLRVCVCASNTVNAEQYFGEGTRLTVLEAGQEIKNPKVTIFDPSEEEIRQRKKATIVCLANDFFPDYLKFSWTANGEEVEEKYVVTDRPQKGTNGLYSASSRATVPLEEWGRKEFSCKVIHYSKDGAEVYAEKKISSKTGLCEGNAERVRKQQIMAKTTYSLLISKSILYMATVIILLLKMKCSGKLAKHFD
ncbi:hypothetical protein scyTo_0012005 [Scyliorhinus torazame]|uniref:Ig-like domain-containing protein n=1 Tax=Scyliorhinus torazame TaxID=75743 RepID=A0A401NZT7_SCYTO|nr:hypothetical protein [Scyliorhinus torazame]